MIHSCGCGSMLYLLGGLDRVCYTIANFGVSPARCSRSSRLYPRARVVTCYNCPSRGLLDLAIPWKAPGTSDGFVLANSAWCARSVRTSPPSPPPPVSPSCLPRDLRERPTITSRHQIQESVHVLSRAKSAPSSVRDTRVRQHSLSARLLRPRFRPVARSLFAHIGSTVIEGPIGYPRLSLAVPSPTPNSALRRWDFYRYLSPRRDTKGCAHFPSRSLAKRLINPGLPLSPHLPARHPSRAPRSGVRSINDF